MKEFKKLLPIPSNQKVNAYLKEPADICNITTNILPGILLLLQVALDNGVPIGSVRKFRDTKALNPPGLMPK